MSKRTRQRLRQIVGRDTRIIEAILGVIQENESDLLTGKRRIRIDESKLNTLIIRTSRGKPPRPTVKHDIKTRFPRASQNELTECRKAAVGMYESYLSLRAKKGWSPSRPRERSSSRRMPRWMFSPRMFTLIQKRTSVSRWWMDVRDALDSAPEGLKRHHRLVIPLKVSPFHENQLSRGEVKAAQVYADRNGKWWAAIAVRLPEASLPDSFLPPAVLGIDLGIKKAVCTTLVTPEKVRETRYFTQKEKVKRISDFDDLVSQLQHAVSTKRNMGTTCDGILRKLRDSRSKRERISKEHDRVLVRLLLDYISQLNEKHTLYVAIGRVKNIRVRARKGNRRGRRFRRMIHSWSFARITDSLKHGLAQLGWSVSGRSSRFRSIPETWTSIMCWKCGSKGIRPNQSLFICVKCGHKTNADRNGAINIAGRLIMLTETLHSVRGLGKWAISVEAGRSARLKARRSKSSNGKSLLPKKEDASALGESAAVHLVQQNLLSFGDEDELCDYDPAAARTVEALAVARRGATGLQQEKEARNAGGIQSR
jgi:transposase